jgi:hypothetical protein
MKAPVNKTGSRHSVPSPACAGLYQPADEGFVKSVRARQGAVHGHTRW